MKLCIAEKPSVGKELARILGANTRHDGYFEGNGYWVSWTFGHLCTLKAPDEYNSKLKWWKLYDLPIIPQKFSIKLIDNAGSKKQFKVLETLIQHPQCEELINCGDAGQEGELIQRWVYHKAGNKHPVKRLWISSLTEEAIREGFQKLQDETKYQHLYEAGSARAIGDWLLGINASRLYTLKYGNGKNVLSVGRVQTPTLAMIVERHHEIANFIPKDFWEVKTKFREVLFSYEKGRFFEPEKAEEMMKQIENELFTIVSFEKKKGKEYAPRMFDLTSLQVESNKKFNLTADETLKTVQQLYEKKIVTYPRVDTTYLPEDQHPKMAGILKGLSDYSQFTQEILAKPIPKSKRVFDNKKITDHHAIIPTGIKANNLSAVERDIYDAITRRFIANFLPVCEISNTKVIGESAKFPFKATGKEILSPGWRVLFGQDDDQSKEQLMPTFNKGEQGDHEPKMEKKQTTPPKYFTEATLLRAMETAGKQVDDEQMREVMKANGIGRPSTRANIIETLFRRRYISRKRKSLIPNATGIELIGSIHNELLKSAELTGRWELKLGQIERGKYDVKVFMSEMKTMVSELMAEVKKEVAKPISYQEPPEKKKKTERQQNTPSSKSSTTKKIICPICHKGEIIKGKTAYGCAEWKSGCSFKILFTDLKTKYQSDSINAQVIELWKKEHL